MPGYRRPPFGLAIHSLYLIWLITAIAQLLSQFCHVGVQPSLRFIDTHAVYPRGPLLLFTRLLACARL